MRRKLYVRLIAYAAVIVAAMLLQACGGGGSSSSSSDSESEGETTTENATVSGLWEGTFTDGGGNTFAALAGISPSGEIRIIATDAGVQYAGNLSVSGSSVSGSFRGYAPPGFIFYNGETLTTGSLSGTVVEKKSISGTYNAEGDDSGSFSLSYHPSSDLSLSLADLQGTWGYDDFGSWVNVVISESGEISGSDSGGCDYAGNARVPDSSVNVFEIDLAVTDCGEANGSYTGLGTLESTPSGDIVWFMVSTPSLSYVDGLPRLDGSSSGSPPPAPSSVK